MKNIKLRVRNLVKRLGTADPMQIAAELKIPIKFHPLPHGIRGYIIRSVWNGIYSYDSDYKYICYFVTLSNEFNDISFIKSIDYTRIYSYRLGFGIAYNL